MTVFCSDKNVHQTVEVNEMDDKREFPTITDMLPVAYYGVYDEIADSTLPTPVQLPTDVEHPHLNSTDYAKRPINQNTRMHENWECIALNDSRHVVIATNKATGRDWSSSLWGFEKLNSLLPQNACYKLKCNNHITYVQFVRNNLFVAGFSNGLVQLWSTYAEQLNGSNPYCLFRVGSKAEHMNAISGMDVVNGKKLATVGRDCLLKLWEVADTDFVSTNAYRFAHTDIINGVNFSRANDSLLATCSSDCSSLLWDLRQIMPATALYKDHKISFTNISWTKATDNNTIYVGDEIGYIHTIDIRSPNSFMDSKNYFSRPIRKISINGDNVAVIANTNILKIFDSNHQNIIYENSDTEHFIRDVVWFDNTKLLTVGCDGRMRKHKISNNKNEKIL